MNNKKLGETWKVQLSHEHYRLKIFWYTFLEKISFLLNVEKWTHSVLATFAIQETIIKYVIIHA